jgi:hypothetical protein
MPDEKEKNQVREATTSGVTLNTAELAAFLPPVTGSLLPDGKAIKVLPSPKDFPADDKDRAVESGGKKLKVTNSDDVNAAYVYKKRLEIIREMLAGASDLATLRTRAKERRDMVSQVFQQNLSSFFVAQRPLEKTYRELHAFFYEARINPSDEEVYGITIVNASANRNFNQLMDAEKGLAKQLPNKGNFDMRNLKGLIVIPEWPGSEAKLMKFGEIAQQSMAHLFVGFPDVSLKDAQEMFAVGGDLADLKSFDPTRIKQHISVVANPLRIRRENRFEKGLGDFYINPAGILGGMIYKGDVKDGIHIARANGKRGKVELPTPDDSPLEMKWKITGEDQMKFNKAVIPLALYQGIVFWGVDTLYLASGPEDQGMDQYSVKRCDEYIAKVLLHYLNGETFKANDQKGRDDIRGALKRFINANLGTGDSTKMLDYGDVIKVDVGKNADNSDNYQALDIEISVRYKMAVRKLNLYLTSNDSNKWMEGKK